MNKDFAMPDDLDAHGKRAYVAIKKHLGNFDDLSTGGCTSFYSPKEWEDRGEDYGKGSKLIVVYDGGELRPYFNMDACYDGHCMLMDFLVSEGKDVSNVKPYDLYENMQDALGKEGLYFEECTGWYAAVYMNP
jgi:hypothetical protein